MGRTALERTVCMDRECEGTEAWSLNNAYLSFPVMRGKWARFFELHKWDYLRKWEAGPDVDHWESLDALGCPVYCIQHLPLIRNQVDYDPIAVCRHQKSNYVLGSPSLILMRAIYEHDLDKAAGGPGIAEIRSFGIDTADDRHAQQRQSWSYWCRAAMERRIVMGGTALNFMAEYDNDEGIRGLREQIGLVIVAEEEAADRAAATAAAEQASTKQEEQP
jgi:hypothetical protein